MKMDTLSGEATLSTLFCLPSIEAPTLKGKNRLLLVGANVITKTYLYNLDLLKPHFYIVKLGFTGVYIIFLISAQKHRLWVLVRTALGRRF